MMKKIILAIGLMFGGVALVNAQEQQQDTTQTQTQTQQSDQYRTDSTSTDDSQNQTQTQSDTTTTEQSDMYRTETESNSSGTDATTTTPPTTDDQSATEQTGVTSEDQEQEGEKIEVSELPAAVQTKLQSTDYQGWVVVSARKKMWTDPSDSQATEKEVYVIEAKNGAETKKLKFDKDGNEIEHDKKKDDQK